MGRKNVNDLLGRKFGRLTVLEVVPKPESSKEKSNRTYYRCKCDCGNEKIVGRHGLVSDGTKSCGCLLKEPSNFEDLTGKRFFRLLVIKRVTPPTETAKSYWKTYYLCKCDCGKERIVSGGNLRQKHVMSCGCYGDERRYLPYGEASFRNLLNSYTANAKKRNITFEISVEKFRNTTKENCFYCGKIPSQVIKSKSINGDYVYNGIDRIDSSKGYTEDNIVACCGRCNQAKMSETKEDFIEWVKRVYVHLGLDKS